MAAILKCNMAAILKCSMAAIDTKSWLVPLVSFNQKNMGEATEQLISKCHGCKDISKTWICQYTFLMKTEIGGSHISSDLTNFPNFPRAGLFFWTLGHITSSKNTKINSVLFLSYLFFYRPLQSWTKRQGSILLIRFIVISCKFPSNKVQIRSHGVSD